MYKSLYFLLPVMIVSLSVCAQCTGSMGTPIINETFGSGLNQFGPAIPNASTTMQYWSATACPEDGYYSILNYTSGCFGEWHTLTDHTGDQNGYFMVIDASFQPSDFFVQTVNGLCDGTTYQFAAWIINMFQVRGGIYPDITFSIEKTDGTVLNTYDTGPIDITVPAKWQQFSMNFKTPPGITSVVIRMHNNAPGGQGNDLGLDDITFTPIGPKTTISVNGANGGFYQTQCGNKTTLVSAVETCYAKNGYQWQISTDNNTWNNIQGANNAAYTTNMPVPGKYYYRLAIAEGDNLGNASCSANSNVFEIDYLPPLTQLLRAAICNGDAYTTPSGKKITTAGTVIDTLTNANGCDSLITTVNLTVNQKVFSSLSAAICQGQAYSGHTKSGTYTDTLTAANGCDSIRTVNLTVEPESFSALNASICNGDSYLGYKKGGTYADTLTAANGCDSIRTINLTVNPEFTLGPDRTICSGDSILLSPGTFSSYLWQDNTTKPYYTVTATGTYWVKITDQNGCSASDTVIIRYGACLITNIPNTFTPNGDGVNDTWRIGMLQGYPQCSVFIYSRWGQQVFKSIGYANPWDGTNKGKKLPVGTYYYIIDLHNNTHPISGFVTIIR